MDINKGWRVTRDGWCMMRRHHHHHQNHEHHGGFLKLVPCRNKPQIPQFVLVIWWPYFGPHLPTQIIRCFHSSHEISHEIATTSPKFYRQICELLVGGVELFFMIFHILGISSSQRTNSYLSRCLKLLKPPTRLWLAIIKHIITININNY